MCTYKAVLAIFLCGTISLSAWELNCRVFPADSLQEIRIRATAQKERQEISSLRVGYIRDDGFFSDGTGPVRDHIWQILPSRTEKDTIVVSVMLRDEHEHTLFLHDPRRQKAAYRPEGTMLKIYSLRPDLFSLRPYKGNVHTHSNRSDGSSSVSDVLIHSRRAGLDFIALTDHWLFAPSQEMKELEKKYRTGVEVFSGEEVHSDGGMLHSISLGGNWQVSRRSELVDEAKKIIPEIAGKFPHLNKIELQYCADSVARFAKMRQAGSFIIYSHPYWKLLNRYHFTEKFNEYMLNNADYDALELFNATVPFSMMLNRWHQLALEGRNPAVVSVSDNHYAPGVELSQFYTIIFAPDCTVESFRNAVKERRSVARAPGRFSMASWRHIWARDALIGKMNRFMAKQDALLKKIESGTVVEQATVSALREELKEINEARRKVPPRPAVMDESLLIGDLRLVRFAMFLEEDYWPRHDEICLRQFKLLTKLSQGDETVRSAIADCVKELENLRKNFYAPIQ